MKTAPALVLAAAGAILAFAVHAQVWFFSFQIAGWVLMATGAAGLLVPRRHARWVRRVTRTGSARVRRRGRPAPRSALEGMRRSAAEGGGRLPIGWTFRRRPNPAVVTAPDPEPSETVEEILED